MTKKPSKKVSPFFTRGIYLYALPLPVGFLVFSLWQMWRWDVFFVMASHLYEVLMLARLCAMLYVVGVVSIGFLEWVENKGAE